MAWDDPVVKEIREIRAQLVAEHGNDLRALCKHLQHQEQTEQRKIVSLPPRRPAAPTSATG